MTKLVSPFEFGRLTSKGAPMPPDAVPVYYGHSFDCACGAVHVLSENIAVLREIPGRNKFVASCPLNPTWMNFLKVKGVFRIAGLETMCSTRIESEKQYEEFCSGVIHAQLI